ncbi:MAG: L-serine ammonia-lyase, iron-sulfur-dependent, subunit alpha [Bacteroidales bacterium]
MNKMIELLKQEVKPALGCTEPIAVALAVAKSVEILGEQPGKIEVKISGNILKNGMGVGIPGTQQTGLYIASALGAICGKSEYKLEVLKDVTPYNVVQALKMVDEKRVTIEIAPNPEKLYVEATVFSSSHTATVIIADKHTNFVKIELDSKILLDNYTNKSSTSKDIPKIKSNLAAEITVKEIYQFATSVDFKDIEFILDCVDMNMALVKEGLKKDCGLRVGKTLMNNNNKSVYGDGLMNYAMGMTAAASDARMAGCMLPAMSNSGSGNQGLAATVPIIVIAEKTGVDKETLARALTISHLVAIHIKGHLGQLSALCGAVIASIGASCGIVYMRNGGYNTMCSAIKNMAGSIIGMICDGAKVGCSLKVAAGVSSAMQAAILALDNVCVSGNDGIIEDDIEKTLQNVAKIGSVGMQSTDELILNIMVKK